MSGKPEKKVFIVTSWQKKREIKAESKRDAFRMATARGWEPLFVEEIKNDEKEKQTHL